VSQNVIELNGKRYDAKTGALLGGSTAHAVKHLAAKQVAPVKRGKKAVDGFFRRPTMSAAIVAPKPKKQPLVKAVKTAPVKPAVTVPMNPVPARAVPPKAAQTLHAPKTSPAKPHTSPRYA
jgi:hypothetical protein